MTSDDELLTMGFKLFFSNLLMLTLPENTPLLRGRIYRGARAETSAETLKST